MIVDKRVNQQIIGCLLKHPQYLSESDKYRLSPSDFHSYFEKYIFTAIYGLYNAGALKISSFDVENYLSSNESAKRTFKDNNGIEYLQDVEEFSNEENFPYYYDKLKKFNLLNEYQKSLGIDVSEFYIEDDFDSRAREVNSKFEDLTITDITNRVKQKLLKIEGEYTKTEEVQTWDIGEEIEDIIMDFGSVEGIGLPIQGSIYSKVINGAERGALTIRSAPSGVGKALPNSVLIPTPLGWRRVDDIKVGDYLFDAFGKPTKVLGVFPQGEKEVYKVSFKDGREAKCCKEHLWSYNTIGQKENQKINRNFITKELQEIMSESLQKKDGGYKFLVPQQYAVEYPEQKHYIPSYIFGLVLGDGSFRQHKTNKSFQFSSEDEYLPNIIANEMGWILKKGSINNFSWYFSFKKEQTKLHEKINIWVEDVLVEHPELINAKSEDKFIPKEYIYDSIENRLNLLNGLLDSDGSVDEKGRVSYFTISKVMAKNVIEICHSLGFKTHLSEDTHKTTNIGYVVHISGRPEDKIKLFKLPRKHERVINWFNNSKRKEKNSHNAIIKIENCNYREEMTCFTVDNEEHLFLTEDFIVTHNTRCSVADAAYLAFPLRYNGRTCQWEQTGAAEKVLFIITEQTPTQILRMLVAYLTDINESKFKYAHFTEDEQVRIEQAKAIIQKYKDNFILTRIPNPTIELVKSVTREEALTKDISVVFYDYIFIGPALLNEFKGFNIRNDRHTCRIHNFSASSAGYRNY